MFLNLLNVFVRLFPCQQNQQWETFRQDLERHKSLHIRFADVIADL